MDDSDTSSQKAIVLTIRPSSGSTFTTAITTDSTVLQLKEKLATVELPSSSIRLVYSGRVLKDEDQLSVYCKYKSRCHAMKQCIAMCLLCNDGKWQVFHTAHALRKCRATAAAGILSKCRFCATTTQQNVNVQF